MCSHRAYTYPSRLLRPLNGYIQRHIVCSKAVKSHLVDILGIPEAKIAYIYDPVDTNVFNPEVPPADLEGLFGVPRAESLRDLRSSRALERPRSLPEGGPPRPGSGPRCPCDDCRRYRRRRSGLRRRAADDVSRAGDRGSNDLHGVSVRRRALDASSDVLVHASTTAEPFGTVSTGRHGLRTTLCGDGRRGSSGDDRVGDSWHSWYGPTSPADGSGHHHTPDAPGDGRRFRGGGASRSVERFSAPTIAKQHLELYREVAEQRS